MMDVGRKVINNVEEKILLATIEVGGRNRANILFSTKEIAQLAGISEFTIYSHFKDKKNLLSKALVFATNIRSAELKRLVDLSLPLEDVIRGLEDFLVARPSLTTFFINYGECIPKIGNPDSSFLAFKERCRQDCHLLEPYLNYPNEETAFLIYSSFVRNLLLDVEMILSGGAVHDSEYERTVLTLDLYGIRGFRKP
jgi:AcrR family transcriptional regulator